MKRRAFLSLLLALAVILSLTGSAFAAANRVETRSALSLGAALSGGGADYARVLVRADTLPEDAGARRVVHAARLGMYVLEYGTPETAALACETLTARYGADRVWLDTPETAATVMDGEPGTNNPEPDPSPDPTPAPTSEPTPTPTAEIPAHDFLSWGAQSMELTAFREDPALRGHYEGRRLTVAVLDTGADPQTLAGRCRPLSPDSYDFVNRTSEMSDIPTGDAAGHGTLVTTLLDDLLPDEAEILLLRVFNDDGFGSRTTILEALDYALEHGADVINMSLGWEHADSSFRFLDPVLEQAAARNIPVVCAAGNRGANAATCYPASHAATLSVAAVSKALTHETFSNFGESVDFCAPGSDIRSVGPGCEEQVSKGTSFSAPHITAAVTDMLLLRPMGCSDLYAALKACCEDLGVEGKDDLYGWGYPRLGRFLEANYAHQWDAGRTDPLATWDSPGRHVYTCGVCGEEREETIAATAGNVRNPFLDVSSEIYYAAPVTWAVANYITSGTSAEPPLFSPDQPCTRGQMVTFLWRAAGSPAPEAIASPFTDARDPGAYYYRAVLWAVEQGITQGTGETTFSPDATVTRSQTVTFLWRMAGTPSVPGTNPFRDVAQGDYYHAAVLWAVSREITRGTDSTHFSPASPCTRAQIVTLLYRYLGV